MQIQQLDEITKRVQAIGNKSRAQSFAHRLEGAGCESEDHCAIKQFNVIEMCDCYGIV